MFQLVAVSRIKGSKKDFHAMQFLFNQSNVFVGYSARGTSRLHLTVNGHTRIITSRDFWDMIKPYNGDDVRKIAGYFKLMKPVAMGEVVAQCCMCGRGVDERVARFSSGKYGKVLCTDHQPGAASAASGKRDQRERPVRSTVGSVPVFRMSELGEMKEYQLKALSQQIRKALEKQHSDDVEAKLVRYLASVQDMMPHPVTGCDPSCSCHLEIHPDELRTREEEELLDQELRDEAAAAVESEVAVPADKAEEDEFEQSPYSIKSLRALRNECRDRGLKGYSRLDKLSLVKMLTDHDAEHAEF